MRFIQLDKINNKHDFIIRLLDDTILYQSKNIKHLYPADYNIIRLTLAIIFKNKNLTMIDILLLLDNRDLQFDKYILDKQILESDDSYKLLKLLGSLNKFDTLYGLLAIKLFLEKKDIIENINMNDSEEIIIQKLKESLNKLCIYLSKCEDIENKDKYIKLFCNNPDIKEDANQPINKISSYINIILNKIFYKKGTNINILTILENNKDMLYRYWYACKHMLKIEKNIDINIDSKYC